MSYKCTEKLTIKKTINTCTKSKNAFIMPFLTKLVQRIDDPPAFTKNKDSVNKAYKGYKEINLQALKIIKSGGYLLTFSCSQHMTPNLFFEMLSDAVKDSKRNVQLVDFRIQAPDHPTLLNSEEQLYLKCVILRVL